MTSLTLTNPAEDVSPALIDASTIPYNLPPTIPSPIHNLIYEVHGRISSVQPVRKNPDGPSPMLLAVADIIVPKLKQLDPNIRSLEDAGLSTNIYRITYEAFNILRSSSGTRKALNLEGSEPFKIGVESALDDYMLVIYRPDGISVADLDSEPFFLTEPSLSSKLSQAYIAAHFLSSCFIKVENNGIFRHSDIRVNQIFCHKENRERVPRHVQRIWDGLAKKRNLMDKHWIKLQEELREVSYPSNWLRSLFERVASIKAGETFAVVDDNAKADKVDGDVETDRMSAVDDAEEANVEVDEVGVEVNEADVKSAVDDAEEANVEVDEVGVEVNEADVKVATTVMDANFKRQQLRIAQEYEHYAHVVRHEEIAAPFDSLSPELGLERTTEYFFFTKLAMHIKRFVPEFRVLDHYKSMPITKLVVEKLDEREDWRRFAAYRPKSDIGIWCCNASWPGGLVELQSGDETTPHIELLEDHIRLLLQGGCLLRMMNIAKERMTPGTNTLTAVLPLIYVTKDWARAFIYLLYQSKDQIFYYDRVYHLNTTLQERIWFTRDLYNLCDHIEADKPSEALQMQINGLDVEIHGISTPGSRLDTKEDKKRKRDATQPAPGNSKRKRNQQETKGEKVDSVHEWIIQEGRRFGYQFEVKSSRLLAGKGSEGNKVVAKRVRSDSEELEIHLKLQDLASKGSTDFFLPILHLFDGPPYNGTRVAYLVFSCWIPLPQIRRFALEGAEIISLCSSLALGIQFLHTNLIAHLDIKPDNLVFQRNGLGKFELRIIDFSVSALLNTSEDRLDSCQGTTGFMAPEVSRCEGLPPSPKLLYSPFKADLYSCGRVFLFFSWSIRDRDIVQRDKVMLWGHKLSAIDPSSRPELHHLDELLPLPISFYKRSPTLINAQLG
ncbi:hypothetical protein D9757_011452 [Collybiopsis confluens]|uniref:Protein kinase domain-containing protein n=1 Tax=Collybiopsis confluens TaxID=2823264 RepID=A0A8H5LR52_9AGAR|nr:hypothetical protein D9757_011452 [Collybiopsis confluens]